MQRKCWNCLHVFVGDSIGNQWESLLCILSSAVLDEDSIYEENGNPMAKHTRFLVFKLQDFNCTTLEYDRAPFLVLQSQKLAGAPEKVKATAKLVKMDWSSNQWKGADVTVLTLAVDGITRRPAEELVLICIVLLKRYSQPIQGIVTSTKGEEVKMEMSVKSLDRMLLEMAIDWIISKLNLNKTRKSSSQYISGGKEHVKKLDFLNVHDFTEKRQSFVFLLSGSRDGSHWCLPCVTNALNELVYVLCLKGWFVCLPKLYKSFPSSSVSAQSRMRNGD